MSFFGLTDQRVVFLTQVFLMPLYHLTGSSSDFWFGLICDCIRPLNSACQGGIFEALYADLKGRAGKRLGTLLEFQGDVNSGAFLSIPPSLADNHFFISLT